MRGGVRDNMRREGRRKRQQQRGGGVGDLPSQRAVNQSDLDQTGTCLVAAPANTAMVRRENVCVTCIPLVCEATRRWIDGSGMKR